MPPGKSGALFALCATGTTVYHRHNSIESQISALDGFSAFHAQYGMRFYNTAQGKRISVSKAFADYVRYHTSVAVAKRFGVAHTTVLRWIERGIPPHRITEVSRITGIPADVLRPDLAAIFSGKRMSRETESFRTSRKNKRRSRALEAETPRVSRQRPDGKPRSTRS